MENKKKKKIWIWVIVAVVLIIVLAVGGVLFYISRIDNTPVLQGVENPHGFKYLGLRPDVDGKVEKNDNTKIMAEECYNSAILKCKNNENLAVHSDCQSIFSIGKMQNYIDVDIVILKTQEKYFRMEYHLKNKIPLFEALPNLEDSLNEMISIVTTERIYYDTSMANAVYQKAKNAVFFEVIFMTYSYIHRMINGQAFPNAINLYDKNIMTVRGRGKYCYNINSRQQGEEFIRNQLIKYFPNNKLIYIC